MANHLLERTEIWWPHLGKPNPSKYADKPAAWSIQIRTTDTNEVKLWKSIGLAPKSHIADEKDPETYYFVNIYKKSEKDGVKKEPPNVANARGQALKPDIVGNGSIANVSLFSYDHQSPTGPKTSFVLMGVQVVELVQYVGKPRQDFKDMGVDTKVIGTSGHIEESDSPEEEEDDIPFEGASSVPANTPSAPSSGKPKLAPNPTDEY